MLSKKGSLPIRVALIKSEKLPEQLIIVADEHLYAFMTVRGEERDNA